MPLLQPVTLAAAEQAVPTTDKRQQAEVPQTADHMKKPRIAQQLLLELMECTQSFLRLVEERGVVLENLKAQRIVNVLDNDLMLFQLLCGSSRWQLSILLEDF